MPGYSGDLEKDVQNFEKDVKNMEMFGGKRKNKQKNKQKKSQKPKQKVHTGPRGGKYILKNGKKVYL